ncbi:hypothetical protein Tco_0086927 [Tanacetum coccineum]
MGALPVRIHVTWSKFFMEALGRLMGEYGVKGIGRVSPMKSKGIGKSDSPKRRWIPISERVSNKPGDIVVNAQPVSQYNPVIGQVVKESNKAQQPKVKPTVDEKDNPKVKPAVMKEKPAVVKEKPAGVTSKVSKGKDDVVKAPVVADKDDVVKAPVVVDEVPVVTDKALVVKATVADKAPVVKAMVVDNVVADKEPVKEKLAGNVGKAPVKDKVKVSVLKGGLALVKHNVKAPVKDKVEVSVLKGSLAPVKDNVNASVKDNVKEKSTGVVYKSKSKVILTVQELSEVPVLRSSNQKVKPEVKSKVVVRVSRSKETPVKRKRILSKEDDRKKKLKGKSKKEDYDSEHETDDVDSSSDEIDRKRKKLKIKAGLKRKRSGSDCSDSSSIDTENIKRLISKLEKKVKKQESDEESVPKKGIGFSSLHNVSIDQLPSKLGRFVVSNFKTETYMLSLDSGDKIEVTHSKIHEILGVPVGGYSLFDLDEREADHEFVRLWVGQFYPTELKQIRVNDIASKLVAAQEIDFLFKVNFLTLFTNTMGKAAGLKGQICLDVVRRLREDCVISDIDWYGYIYDCLQGSKLMEGTNHYLGPLTFLIELELKDRVLGLLDLHGEWTEAEMQDVEGFIGSLETSEKEDFFKKAEEKFSLICAERVMLEEYMREASLEYPSDGKFLALHEKYVNLFKDPISFNDDGNGDNGGDDDDRNGDNDEDDDANDGDGNGDEEDANEGDKDPNGSNPSFGFTKISLDDFGNDSGDLFGDNSVTMEVMNQGLLTPERMLTSVSNVSPGPEKRIVKPFLLPVIPVHEQEDKSSHCGKFIVFGIRLNLETLAPVLNHEESFRAVESKSRHFSPTGCITKSMFGGTLDSDDAKWESFSNQVKAQFEGNDGGLTLEGIDLKKLFARHLKLYGHIRHSKIAKVKQAIPKLKWKTKANFHDCGIFTMLHMETFNDGPATNWDCGLPVESQLQRDMLRRLRFKFATKILLHEINVHAEKMLELAKEFDKRDSVEKMAIIVDALKNREQRDRI